MKYIFLALILCSAAYAQTDDERDERYESEKPREEQSAYVRSQLFLHPRIHSEGGYNLEYCVRYIEAEQEKLKISKEESSYDPLWTFLGPKPGNLTSYGNVSGRIRAIALNSNGSTVFVAGAGGGVWKSTDGGVTFVPVGDAFASLSMGALAVSPANNNIVFAGTGELNYGSSFDEISGGGLYRSTNGGTAWALVGETSVRAYADIVPHPTNSNIVLAATSSGVRRSTNGGITFTTTRAGIIHSLLYDPNNVAVWYCGVTYNSQTGQGGVYKSQDTGKTWSAINSGLPTTSIGRPELGISKANSNILYVSIFKTSDSGTVYKSVNAGTNWSPLPTPLTDCGIGNQYGQAWFDHVVAVDPTNASVVYLGLIDLFKSNDGGNTWTNLSKSYCNGTQTHPDQHALVFHPTAASTFFLGNDGGFYKSTNGGISIINENATLGSMQFYRIASDKNNATGIFGGLQDNGTERLAGLANGTTFATCIGGDGFQVYYNPSNSSIAYAEQQFGKIFRSSDGIAGTWTEKTSGLPNTSTGTYLQFFRHYVIDPVTPSTLYWASADIYKTVNDGDSWTKITSTPFPTDPEAFAIASSDHTKLYIGLYNPTAVKPEVYRSTTSGTSWTKMTGIGLPNAVITNISISPSNADLIYVVFAASGASAANVYRSNDGGTTWTNVSGNLPGIPCNTLLLHPADPANVWIVGTDFGAYVTQNAGATWTKLSNGLPNVAVFDISHYAGGKKIRFGTHGRGIWEADATLPPVSVEEHPHESFALGLNYPNPVRTSTTIPVPGGRGVLRIRDVFGREVQCIELDGSPAATIDASNLPNGLYYYIVELHNEVFFHSMLVIK